MQNFFENIKIRKLLLIYAGIIILLCVISEVPVIKSLNILTLESFTALCNLGIIVWIFLEAIKANINIKSDISNLKKDLKYKDIVLSIVVNIAITIGSFIVAAYILSYVAPSLMARIFNNPDESSTSTLYRTIANAVGIAIIAPIAEEFMFRGVIFNRLKIRMGVKKAVIISSVLFGLIHYELAMIPAVIFGVFMCLIYLKTKNIFVTSAIHVINNSIVSAAQVIVLLVSNDGASKSTGVGAFNFWQLMLGSVAIIVSIVLSVYFIKTNLREIKADNEEIYK